MRRYSKSALTTSLTILLVFIFLVGCKKEATVDPNAITDYDGNIYHSVQIGSQVWMVENLRVTHYRNGDPITDRNDVLAWYELTDGAYCEYNSHPGNIETFGLLYNWIAVNDSRNLAPVGWHVASHDEWKTLIDTLGGWKVAGGKLKIAGYHHWFSPNKGATNESGFTALGGGYRSVGGEYRSEYYVGYWWTSTVSYTENAFITNMSYDNPYVFISSDYIWTGASVRCIKDTK